MDCDTCMGYMKIATDFWIHVVFLMLFMWLQGYMFYNAKHQTNVYAGCQPCYVNMVDRNFDWNLHVDV